MQEVFFVQAKNVDPQQFGYGQDKGLHAGQMVKVSQAKVFDYIRRHPDGRHEGNETGRIIMRQQQGGGK